MLGTIMACSALLIIMIYMIVDTKIREKREKENE
jgi:hypothetical protein